ncbi:hypothetical protein BaRGS_00012578 [Batillaria attramentaria]|uniref:Uncharacterized protein n=1 Tax=Batillaria attramentaria TaxID=370345 RepID=A0ABD0LAB9_9CAEN
MRRPRRAIHASHCPDHVLLTVAMGHIAHAKRATGDARCCPDHVLTPAAMGRVAHAKLQAKLVAVLTMSC